VRSSRSRGGGDRAVAGDAAGDEPLRAPSATPCARTLRRIPRPAAPASTAATAARSSPGQ
ncbi:zinc finger protein, partial [Musa troglodytarum]